MTDYRTLNMYAKSNALSSLQGGKAKPLKAPKKEKKDLDEDEIAYREKQKAGKQFSLSVHKVSG